MNRFQRSWALLKASLSVIGRNKVLLVFPIVTFICTIIIGLFFLAPPLLRPTGYSYASAQHWEAVFNSLFAHTGAAGHGDQYALTPGALAYVAFLYFCSMLVATYFNVAFYHEILAALGGDAVSIGRGLKFAFTRFGAILMWTIFAGLVGLLIKLIERRLSWVGAIIARFLGLAWSIAAVFAIPVIVREEQTMNPVGMLKKSAECIKRTWGEALIGYTGLAVANVLILFGSLLFLGGAMFASVSLHNYWIIAGAGFSWFIAMVVWSYVTSVASQVYKGALYLYAAEGVVAQPYTEEMLHMAWKFKK